MTTEPSIHFPYPPSAVCQHKQRHPELKICAKFIMPDHIHIVVWRQDATEDSIRQLGKGFAQGCSKIAREVAHGGSATQGEQSVP